MTGWLTPKHEFVACKPYEHYEIAQKDARLCTPKILEIAAELEADRLSREAMSDAGEHPEWHSYDSAVSDAQHEVWAELLKGGNIRVGLSHDRKSLHFEGIPIALQQHAAFCKEFAELQGKTAVFEPQKKFSGYTDPTYAGELAEKSAKITKWAAKQNELARTNPMGSQ